MKKIVSILFFFVISVTYSQDKDFGGMPVQGVTTIKRQQPYVDLSKSDSNSKTVNPALTPTAPTGNSTEVGITEGQLDVSLTGGATYTIPIMVPQGINGVAPQLSLTYNSQDGNGVAGFGWNISGISSISKTTLTKYHDGTINAIDFQGNSRYVIDGQRLMLKNTSDVYGGNGTEYQTENFSNIKITSYGVSPYGPQYGPAYFIVQYPDGSVAKYGANDYYLSTTQVNWYIESWTNPQGLKIAYGYGSNGSNLFISTIHYSFSSSNVSLNKIDFIYKERQRAESGYIGNGGFANTKILSEIKVYANNVGYRNYVLEHNANSLGYERLVKITEKSGDGTKSYNPTIFSYTDTTTLPNELFKALPTVPINLGNINSQNTATVSGDFDADGKTDLILYPITGVNAKKKYYLYTNIQSNSQNLGYDIATDAFESIFANTWLSWNNKIMPSQGWSIIKTNPTTNLTAFSSYASGGAFPVYFQEERTYEFPKFTFGYFKDCSGLIDQGNPGENGTVDPQPSGIDPVWTVVERNIPKEYLDGDFNGDGLTDVLAIEKSVSISYSADCMTSSVIGNPGGTAYFINLDRRITSNFVNIAGSVNATAYSRFIVGDVNSDGKSDIMVFDSGIVKVYTLNANNELILLFSRSDAAIKMDKPLLLGDFNGDGKTDFVIPQVVDGDVWSFFTSVGYNFVKRDKAIGLGYYLPYYGYLGLGNWGMNTYSLVETSYIASDFNSDGKSDILYQQNITVERIGSDYALQGTPQYTNFQFSENKTAANGDLNFSSSISYLQAAGIRRSAIPVITNHNQKNLNQEFSLISGNAIQTFQHNKDNRQDVLLRKITTGNGVSEYITYRQLKDSPEDDIDNVQLYRPTWDETYPNMDLKFAIGFNVVSKLEMQSQNTYKKQLFGYYGAVTNVEGQGFIGFRSLMRTNWFNDVLPPISTVTKYDLTKRGAMIESYATLNIAYNFESTPSSYINKSVMTYDSQLLPNKVFKIKNTKTISYDGLTNTSSESNVLFDNFNNPTESTTITKSGSTIDQTRKTIIAYDLPVTSPYILGRPKQKNNEVKINVGQANEDLTTSEEIYSYNANHLISEVKAKGHNTDYITEKTDYDVFGNVIKKTIATPNLQPRITNFEHDTSGRFLIKMVDIESLATAYEYNNFGWLTKETNPYGLATTYGYDVWGKRILTTDYLTKKVTVTYTKPEIATTLISSVGDDGSESVTKLDDLGREIVSGGKNVDGSWSFIKSTYDDYNRKISVGEPVAGIAVIPSQYTTYSYDEYGRLKTTVEPTGKTTTFAYSGLTTIATDGIKTITTVKNAIGNTTSVNDNGGTINYQYFATGNLKQTNYDGTEIKIVEDGWGRRKSLDDPSAGLYSYEYNDLGEIKKEITPKGVTEYKLDDYTGRLLEKTIIGDLTNSKATYNYDSSKLLSSSTFKDNIENTQTDYTYGYDTSKRIIKTTESTPTKAGFERQIVYDDFGRPLKEFYSMVNYADGKTSSKWTRNSYKNGATWQILDDATSKVLWQTNFVNVRGQLTEARLGNGIVIKNTYDNYGYISEIKHDKVNKLGGVNIMTLTTDFTNTNPTRGNLNSRSNNMFAWNETFKYDIQDRLTEFTNLKGEQENQFYNDNGTITQNNLGLYKYKKPGKKYQNSSIEVTPEAFAYYNNKQGVFNDSMEDKKGWDNATFLPYAPDNGFFSYDNSIAFSGNYSLKLINTATTEKYVHADKWIAIDNAADTQYTVTAFVYSETNNPDPEMVLFMKNQTETGYYTQVESVTTNIKGSWEKITKTITVPASIKKLNIRLDVNGIGTVRFDDVSIVKTAQFTDLRRLDISYNAFKKPIDIIETTVDKVSFTYNDTDSRSAMYYGGFGDKMTRTMRKYYSADGSMEIKHNIVTGAVELLTYISGDAYSAPLVLKSDGITQQYLYLHRDYQGSILAISNEAGAVIEKRLFDPWGNLIKVQDGTGNVLQGLTVLDRGYTGHEHIQSVGIINMNGRLYDAVLHRFLSPDNNIQEPYNTQSYNRYGYVMNNPLRYVDPTGEIGEGPGGGNGGTGNGTQYSTGFSALRETFEGNRQWFNNNFNIKSWSNWGSNNLKSINKWFDNNLRSVGKWFKSSGDSKVANLPTGSSSFASNYGNNSQIASNITLNSSTEVHYGGAFRGQKVLEAKTSFLGKLWARLEPREWKAPNGLAYSVNPDGTIGMIRPTQFDMGLMEWVEGGGIPKAGEKVYEVYKLVNKETGIVEYVGKTSQGMMKRFEQHLLDPAKQAWINNVEQILFKGNLTKFVDKFHELTEILKHGLGKLYNRINAVAEKYWVKYGIKK